MLNPALVVTPSALFTQRLAGNTVKRKTGVRASGSALDAPDLPATGYQAARAPEDDRAIGRQAQAEAAPPLLSWDAASTQLFVRWQQLGSQLRDDRAASADGPADLSAYQNDPAMAAALTTAA